MGCILKTQKWCICYIQGVGNLCGKTDWPAITHLSHDNGGEFITKEWKKFLKDWGIHHETTSPDTPEQNGDAEQQNWTIFGRIWTILIDAGLPLFLFAESINYIIYTKNCHSTSALTNTTPYEVHFNKKPDILRLRPFGCKAYVYKHSPKYKKLLPRAYEGIFIGYADTQKAYWIYIPKKRTVICTVHVCFNVNTNMANSSRLRARFNSNTIHSSLPSRNLMTPMTMIPSWNLHHLLPLLTSSKSLHLHLFPMFWKMFPMFLLHNLIHQLAVHINLDCYLLHRHLHPTLLQPQIEEMPTSTRRLDSPTLFPSQQIILTLLMLSQMLIQG